MSAQIPIRLIRPSQPLDIGSVVNLPTLGSSCMKCAEWGGLDDKVVVAITGVDAAVWSRIKSGQANPSGDFMQSLMDAAGNEAPLLWLIYRRGYDPSSLRRLETELEAENRRLQEQLKETEKRIEIITEFVHGKPKPSA